MAKQNRKEKDYETVDQFADSREQRADIDDSQTVSDDQPPWPENRSGQMTGRLQEDRNGNRR